MTRRTTKEEAEDMSMIGRRTFIKHAAAAGALLSGGLPGLGSAFAQEAWPNRPVKFIVPLAPGGGIDFVARAVGEFLSRHIGQQVVVENRTGAGGTIGMDTAMKSPPDGYTVLITNDNAASAPHVMSMPYDYTKELVPVMFLARQPTVLCAHPSLGINTVAELLTYVKANPGAGYATSGVGTNQHILGEWFKRETGLKLDHVPYRGAGQAINDLIAGHVKIALLGPTATVPHYKAGTLRILAQSSAKRAPYIAEIPTLEEAGFKGLILESWYGAFVPKGTPAAIVTRINAEMAKALADPAMLESFVRGSMEAAGGTPADFGAQARADSTKYERLVRELGIKIN
jgi:tripartite-type tricarboxylate transporter receptor subunit TctC